MSQFKEKFRDKAETVQKDGSTRKESVSNSGAPSRMTTSHRKTTTTAGSMVQIAPQTGKPVVQQPQQPPGTLLQEQAVVVPKYKTNPSPVVHPSHHNVSIGVTPKPAEGVFKEDRNAARTRRPMLPEEMISPEGAESPSPEAVHHRRERRLPELPDFKSPPPIVHGRRLREPDPLPIIGEYRPHTLREFKKMKEAYAHQKFGGLGPEDNEEKQRAREKMKRIFDYGRAVNAVNFTFFEIPEPKKGPPQPIPRKLCKEAEIGLIKRERAMQYAVEATRRRPNSMSPDPHDRHHNAELEAELERLLNKHHQDAEEIQRIKHLLQLEER